MRDRLTTALELVGLILIIVAGFMWALPAGVAALGAVIVLLGYLLGAR